MIPLILGAMKSGITNSTKKEIGSELDLSKKKTINAKSFFKKEKEDDDNKSSSIVLASSSLLSTKKISSLSLLDKEPVSDKKLEIKNDPKKGTEDIVNELASIKKILTKIDALISANLSKKNLQSESDKIQKSKEKSKSDENKLENKKKLGLGSAISSFSKPGMSFFDTVLNYFTNIFLGSLAVFALSKLPQIITAFNSIGKNLSNTFNQIKFSVISLTRNFPKQIKFLLKLFQKIATSKPAKSIANLLLTAGKSVATIFGKASKAIFNVIKGPLKNLLGKSASSALRGAAKGVSSIGKRGLTRAIPRALIKIGGKNAAVVAKRLGILTATGSKHFSRITPIFKRIPFIGSLIGIGIDLALGVKPDVAVAGAIGSALGATIGGAIGTGLIPIPGLGTFLGGVIGAGVGDWAGKEIYKNLSGNFSSLLPVENKEKIQKKVQKKEEGGESETTRKTSVEKRTIKKIIIDRPIRRPGKYIPLKKPTEDAAKKYFFKNDNKGGSSFERFKRISNSYSDLTFVGPLLRLGIDIGLGEIPNKSNTDVAADSLAYSIAVAIKREKLKFPGVNANTSGTIANSLSSWARNQIYNEIMTNKKKYDISDRDKKYETLVNVDPRNENSTVTTSDEKDFWILSTISLYESKTEQGAADVAQSIYNRMGYSKKSARKLILEAGQYTPVGKFGKASDWDKITDKESAINHIKNFPGNRASINGLEKVSAALLNTTLQKNAADFVGNRPDFRSEPHENSNNDMTEDKTRDGQTFGFNNGSAYLGKSSLPFNVPTIVKGTTTVSKTIPGSAGTIPAAMVTGGLKASQVTQTSPQGWRNGKMHKGIDMSGGPGSLISSAQDATVVHAGFIDDGYGYSVILKYSNGAETRFGHLQSTSVKTGQKIRAGQLLGKEGSTGRSTGPHLHFEYYPSGGAMTYEGYGNADAVKDSYIRYGGNVKPIISTPTPTPTPTAPPTTSGQVPQTQITSKKNFGLKVGQERKFNVPDYGEVKAHKTETGFKFFGSGINNILDLSKPQGRKIVEYFNSIDGGNLSSPRPVLPNGEFNGHNSTNPVPRDSLIGSNLIPPPNGTGEAGQIAGYNQSGNAGYGDPSNIKFPTKGTGTPGPGYRPVIPNENKYKDALSNISDYDENNENRSIFIITIPTPAPPPITIAGSGSGGSGSSTGTPNSSDSSTSIQHLLHFNS